MFTGIIEAQGTIQEIVNQGSARLLKVNAPYHDLDLGESVAVDGVCLTVTEILPTGFCCDVSPETLLKTTMSQYRVGSHINLERALCVGDRVSGHWVQGHVDATLQLAKRYKQQAFETLVFSGFDPQQACYLIPKGSIALNGVSLTINEITDDAFSVMLIPETLRRTNLANLLVGQIVNVEFDYLAKVVVRQQALSEQIYE